MDPQIIYWILLGVLCLSFLIGESLSLLNSSIHRGDIDPRVADFYDTLKYQRSLAYQKATASFTRSVSMFTFILTTCFLAFGGFGRLDGFLALYLSNPTLRSLVFLGVIYLGSDILALPFEVFGTFRLEDRFGFNTTTPATFIADKIKGYLLTIVLGGGVLFLLITLVQKMGPLFWIVFAAIAILLTLFVNMFYTTLLLPLFNKLSPLPDGELKDAVSAYAARTSLALEGIYVIDGSRRSNKANAFFSGLGPKKKIVLYDTLIKNHPIPELIAILAHEAGHLKKNHIVQGFIFSAIQIFAIAWVFSWTVGNESLSRALGGVSYALHLNLVAFAVLYAPLGSLTGLLAVMTSRAHEYQADAYASETTNVPDMIRALGRLSSDNLANLYPHPLYVFFNYSHPPLLRRIEHLEKLQNAK